MPRESYVFSMSYLLRRTAPFFCMLTSVRIRSFGMASNRGEPNRYRFSHLLFGMYLILHHNFMCFFSSFLDLLIDALDVRRADLPVVLLSHTAGLRVAGGYTLPVFRLSTTALHPSWYRHPVVAMTRPDGAWYPSTFL